MNENWKQDVTKFFFQIYFDRHITANASVHKIDNSGYHYDINRMTKIKKINENKKGRYRI